MIKVKLLYSSFTINLVISLLYCYQLLHHTAIASAHTCIVQNLKSLDYNKN